MTIALAALLGLLALIVLANLAVGRLPRAPRAGGGVIETAHGPLHYVETPGEGPPVVFLHGMPGSCREFDRVRALLPGRHTVAFDRPGYAWSRGAPQPFTAQVDAVAEASGALGIERAVVAGHSFGGLAALGLAIRHPGMAQRLLLLAPAAGGSRVPERQLREARWMLRMQRPGVRHVADLLFQRLLRKYATRSGARRAYGDSDDAAEPRRIAESVLARPGSVSALANDRLLFNDAERLVTRQLARIEVPSVILHGSRDSTVPMRNAGRLAAALPRATLIEIDAGHQLPVSDAVAVVEALAHLESL